MRLAIRGNYCTSGFLESNGAFVACNGRRRTEQDSSVYFQEACRSNYVSAGGMQGHPKAVDGSLTFGGYIEAYIKDFERSLGPSYHTYGILFFRLVKDVSRWMDTEVTCQRNTLRTALRL
jgi:hypothetical protein